MNELNPIILLLFSLLFILLLVIIVLLVKSNKNGNLDLKYILQAQQMEAMKTLHSQQSELIDRLDQRFDGSSDQLMQAIAMINSTNHQNFVEITQQLNNRLNTIDNNVINNLEEGFKKSNATFNNVLERLVKINEAQKKIDDLTTNITSLQGVLTDKQSRGIFGEVQLHQILASIFGDKNDRVYQLQYTFRSSVRSDAVVFAPEPLGTIAIDSKFPLENYRRMVDENLDGQSRAVASKQFVTDCKKHINDVANKYIIPDETGDQALMFLPAEAVFAYIHAYLPEIITYANKQRVWIVSPTTLMATMTTIQTVLQNIERNRYTAEIHKQLNGLQIEFERYSKRWTDLSKHFDLLNKDFHDVHTTSQKISNTFERIHAVEIGENYENN